MQTCAINNISNPRKEQSTGASSAICGAHTLIMVIDFPSAAVHSLILFSCARIYRFYSMPRHTHGRVMKCWRREVWQVNCPLGASFFFPFRPPYTRALDDVERLYCRSICFGYRPRRDVAESSSGRSQIRPIDFSRKKPIFLYAQRATRSCTRSTASLKRFQQP